MEVVSTIAFLILMVQVCLSTNPQRFIETLYLAENRALLNHVFQWKTVSSPVICGRNCSMDPQCASFNYQTYNHVCEFNNITRVNSTVFTAFIFGIINGWRQWVCLLHCNVFSLLDLHLRQRLKDWLRISFLWYRFGKKKWIRNVDHGSYHHIPVSGVDGSILSEGKPTTVHWNVLLGWKRSLTESSVILEDCIFSCDLWASLLYGFTVWIIQLS